MKISKVLSSQWVEKQAFVPSRYLLQSLRIEINIFKKQGKENKQTIYVFDVEYGIFFISHSWKYQQSTVICEIIWIPYSTPNIESSQNICLRAFNVLCLLEKLLVFHNLHVSIWHTWMRYYKHVYSIRFIAKTLTRSFRALWFFSDDDHAPCIEYVSVSYNGIFLSY